MKKLINWTAKRAGGAITIDGIDAGTMKPIKIVGVDMIRSAEKHSVHLISKQMEQTGVVVATGKDGEEYELA